MSTLGLLASTLTLKLQVYLTLPLSGPDDHFHDEWGNGTMEEQLQRQFWHPHWHWARVEKEDAEMSILPWASRARKEVWMAAARFGTAIARCNAGMTSRSQHIADSA